MSMMVMNIACVICSELFVPGENIFSTQCGHIFHYHCVLKWVIRAKTCPHCRREATEESIHKLFFTHWEKRVHSEATLLQKLENVNFSLTLKEKEVKNLNESKQSLEETNKCLKSEIAKLESEQRKLESSAHALKEKIKYYKEKSKESETLSAEVLKLKNKIKDMEHLEIIIKGTRDEVNDVLKEEHNAESLALLTVTLKKSLLDSERKVREMDAEIKRYKNQIVKIKNDYKAMLAGFAERRREAGQVKRKKGMESNILNQRAISEQSSNMNSENVVYISSSDSDTDDTDTTLTVAERVETIAASDSPYLPVKSKFGSILDMKYHTSSSSSGISTRHLATTSSAADRMEIITIPDSDSPYLPVNSNLESSVETIIEAPMTAPAISGSIAECIEIITIPDSDSPYLPVNSNLESSVETIIQAPMTSPAISTSDLAGSTAECIEIITIPDSDSPYLPANSNLESSVETIIEAPLTSPGISTSDLAGSTVERSETITDSESPDLPVKSNFGSFLETKYQAPSTSSSISTSDLATVSSTSALFKSYQKLAMAKHPTCTKSFDEAYDGLGGSKKEDVYPSSKRAQSGMKRAKGTCSSAKFRKLAPL